jgi:hypothetical protein
MNRQTNKKEIEEAIKMVRSYGNQDTQGFKDMIIGMADGLNDKPDELSLFW